MPLDRLRLLSAKARLWRWLLDEVVHAPLEPILHPSRARLQYLGAFTILGHIAFGWIWIELLPQPYENLATRLAMASLGIPLLIGAINRDLTSHATIWIYSMACWLQLPMFFSLMYWLNGGNDVWLASMACMLVIYYHLTDWRLATLGAVAGVVLSLVLARTLQGALNAEATQADHLVVLAFAWGAALMLGASSANLRRTRLINTLSTMGVMAHELAHVFTPRLAGHEEGEDFADAFAAALLFPKELACAAYAGVPLTQWTADLADPQPVAAGGTIYVPVRESAMKHIDSSFNEDFASFIATQPVDP